MSELAKINFDRSLSGIKESTKVVRSVARVAIINNGDPRVMANQIDQIAADLSALARDIRAQALDPMYDSNHAYIATPEFVASELVKNGSNSG